MIKVKVQNIVASTAFADKLDLDMIAKLEEAKYEPEHFHGLVYRLSDPKTATILFRSGNANCTGAKNVEDVHKAVEYIADTMRKLGLHIYKNPIIAIQNIVAVADLEEDLDLTGIAIALGMENIEYEPEQFPGMVYKLKEPKVAMLLFSTGKIVCVGAKNVEDISRAVEKLSKELDSLGLLH